MPIHHVEVDANLEEPDGRHQAVLECSGAGCHAIHRVFQVLVGGHRQGEPEIVVRTLAGVIVTYAGVLVYLESGVVQTVRRECHRHQRSFVSETPRVEDSTYLAYHVGPSQACEPLQDRRFVDAQLLAYLGVWLVNQGKPGLDDVEQLPVENVDVRLGFARGGGSRLGAVWIQVCHRPPC